MKRKLIAMLSCVALAASIHRRGAAVPSRPSRQRLRLRPPRLRKVPRRGTVRRHQNRPDHHGLH